MDRLQEKTDLQTLNDRHANLANKTRELQREKNALQEQLRILEETTENRIREFKSSYEKQLDQMRNKLDLECRNSAKKLIEFERYRQSDKEKQNEINVLTSDLKQLEKRNSVLSHELDSLKQKLTSLTDNNEQQRKLLQNLENEKNALEKTAKSSLAQAEAERLRCIGLEGKIRALEDKLTTQAEFHERELEELRQRHEQECEEQIEDAVNNEIKYLETELMMKSRRELEEKVNQIRQDLEKAHSTELNRLREQLAKMLSVEKALNAKIGGLEMHVDKLNARIHENNVVQSNLNSRIGELEGLLEIEKSEKNEILEAKEREIRELEAELKSKDNENQLVVDANVALKDEIRIYSNLLEAQEKSLNEEHNSSPAHKTRTSSGGQRRYSQAVRKRKRNDEVNETTIVNRSVGPIAIDESTDQFIRLINRSEEPVSLGGWELKRENSEDGATFKFSKSIVVQPGETVTTYSVEAEGAVHNPPVAIKLKRNWPIGGVTTLVNANKEEIARWEWSLQSKRSRFDFSGDEANKSCALM